MTGTDRRVGRTDARPGARAALVLGLLSLAALVPGLGLGQAPARELVADVYVVGNRTIATEKVLAYVTNTRKNMEYSFARVQDDVIRLTNTHMFRNVRVRTDPTQDGRMNV